MVYAGGNSKRRARGLNFFVVAYIITLNGKKCSATSICDLVVFLHTLLYIISSVDNTVQTFFAKVLKFGQYLLQLQKIFYYFQQSGQIQ